MAEMHSASPPTTARMKRCLSCPVTFEVRGQSHRYCRSCADERRKITNTHCTKQWRESNVGYRTQVRSEYRATEDAEYGRVVYKHVDPITKATIYVGSGSYSRARSCRRGGGFQRSPEHVLWYKTHRRLGTISTFKDFVVILHRNVNSESALLILEGQETINELSKGFSLFNKILPNPKRLVLTDKDIVRSLEQSKKNECGSTPS